LQSVFPFRGELLPSICLQFQVSLTQARIDMSELDEDGDGFLQPQEMEAYIRGLIPNLAQLRNIPPPFLSMYSRIAARKFFFFCDPLRRGLQLSP
jgi:serine/threonine-protein phosphatase 2A regulatory subunit B''